VLGNVYVVPNSFVHDLTTGSYMFPTTTTGATTWSNESGYTASYVAYSWDFSNPAYWSQNYSHPGSWTNITYGAGGSFGISSTPTFYFNGSFSGTNKYVLGFYIDNEVYSEQAYYKGLATASLNAATLGNHEDITSVSVY